MIKITYFTKEGLKKLNDELHHLKTKGRADIAKQIAEARDKGDLSENAEYDAAKEAQGMLELQISKMEETLSNARLIDESQLASSKVLVLSTVEEAEKLKKYKKAGVVSQSTQTIENVQENTMLNIYLNKMCCRITKLSQIRNC